MDIQPHYPKGGELSNKVIRAGWCSHQWCSKTTKLQYQDHLFF